jgi:hypothetical protein
MTDPTRRKKTPPESRAGQDVGGAPTGVTDGNLTRSMELGDFMEQLGLVMRLPRRRKGKEADTQPAKPPTPAGTKRPAAAGVWWGPLLLVGIVLLLGYLALRPSVGNDPLPPAAFGRWITDDPRYVERGFTLDSLSVVFYTGSETADFTRHSIVGTTVRTDHGKELVSVDYLVGDGTMTLAFWVEPGAEPTIHFMNQPEIAWKRGFWPGR